MRWDGHGGARLLGDAVGEQLEAVVRPRLGVGVGERDEPLDVRLQLVVGHVLREPLAHLQRQK
eukprot:2745747-Prymnesium_polylepis.1